ncbi:MAG: hypothetical protein COT24_01780 [Candidatus Kerfeldbacteria bacterium CG08_land_8_20_14_0_20_40_16]|uniref:histidine kinase n=1 Tax=Candidatus Kerfeldbacteria bacterium CG08_land_8_20_14_0_20_40_16 TaxID=2014244 RepID=A0A2H0YWC3_9BACT|nr:MAG: hypothetical protein COT24_01780 [Candidatus Kerfeldbacteria bacterium CG08_land_8_20_14_0_20_40_16]
MLLLVLLVFITMTEFILGCIVLLNKKYSLVNRYFFYFSMGVILWTVSNYLADALFSFFWTKMTYVGSTFIGIFLILFSYYFYSRDFSTRKWILLYTKVVTPVILLLIWIPKLFLKGITTYPGGVNLITGKLYFFYPLFFFTSAAISLWVLIKKYKKANNVTKLQLRYFLIGIFISLVIGFLANSLIPFITTDYTISKFGPFGVIFFIAFTAYAIIRHRLMDIRLVISRSLLYLILVAFVTTIFTFLTFFTATVFNDVLGANAIFTTFFVSLILVLTLEPLKKYIGQNTDKIFFKARIDYQNVLRMISEIISLEIDLNSLTYSVSKILKEELKLSKAILFLPNKTGGGFTAVADSRQVGTRITKNHPLLPYLKKYRDFIVIEEMEREIADLPDSTEKKRMQLVLDELQDLDVSLCVPVFVEGEMKSILMLGKKLSGEIFSKDDFDLLEVFAPQLGTALEKAKLYKEVKDFNIKLKEEVKRATSKLRVANADLEERNVFLENMQGITNLITRTLDFKKVMQGIVNSISEKLKYVGGILLLVDEEQTSRVYIEAITETPLTKKAIKLLPGSIKEYGDNLNTGKTLTIKAIKTGDFQMGASFADFVSPPVPKTIAVTIQKLLGIRTAVAIPIFSEDRIVGAIIFGLNREQKQVSELDYNIMNALADQTGIVYKNLELVNEIRKTNEKLQVANRHLKDLDEAKSEFMSIASHQLRTPLSGIMGYLSMMSEGDFGVMTKEQAHIIQELLEASQRLIRMVNLFLNITRIEAGRFKLNLEKVDIVKVIQAQIKTMRPTTAKKSLKLEFKTPTVKIPPLELDQDKIKDVLLNLVDNAIKYTEKGGITVFLDKTLESVVVSVKDTGVGIDPKEAEKLFSKFVRGSGISRLSPDGSGLGLFIARKIVDAHKGKIWVESEGAGKGSTFKFELPIK